jgi:hypothetical protein
MRWQLITAAVLIVSGCSASAAPPTIDPSTTPVTLSTASPAHQVVSRVSRSIPTTHVDHRDYRHNERFCAVPPADGSIAYVVHGHTVGLRLHVTGLPADANLGVEWHNAHSRRGYTIAAFLSDAAGAPLAHSLRMFRPGGSRASKVYLATTRDGVVIQLRPCQ